jgi:hypothetical protein
MAQCVEIAAQAVNEMNSRSEFMNWHGAMRNKEG